MRVPDEDDSSVSIMDPAPLVDAAVMTIQVGSHTAVIHGWGDGPMEAVGYAMERAPNLVENGWAIRSVSHTFGPDQNSGGKHLYSAVVLVTRRETYEVAPEDSGTGF